MPNNPVQILLNDSAFITASEKGRGGPRKEFFETDDGSFSKHKQALRSQVAAVEVALSSGSYQGTGIVRARLKDIALAKSHRPTRAVLRPELFPCVGAGSLGELFFFASRENLSGLIDAIDSAEERTTTKRGANGKPYFAPSDARSDVGAIESIDLVVPEGKRQFSVEMALSWMADPHTLGGYLIELFEVPTARTGLQSKVASLGSSLVSLLQDSGQGTIARIRSGRRGPPLIEVSLNDSTRTAQIISDAVDVVSADEAKSTDLKEPASLDLSKDRHELFLSKLAEHPLVRKISLPFRLVLQNERQVGSSIRFAAMPKPIAGVEYPRVGIVDNGVSAALGHWVLHRHDFLTEDEVDTDHGTFIAGLLTSGQALNGTETCPESDGCEIVDIPLYPKSAFRSFYHNGFDSFLEEVENAVVEAKANYGVRVFNLSINVTQAVDSSDYSYYASRLDDISDRHDVVIVNSVGNLAPNEFRSPWPRMPKDVLAYFATRTNGDTIYQPCESARAVSVGAVNPINCVNHIAGAPTTYTRRGPGLKVGQKPDVAHFGGSQGFGSPPRHGLTSLAVSGSFCDGAGTSYAAPLVAKTLAALDARTLQRLPPHSLRSFLIHHARVPDEISNVRLRDLTRQFVGFGVPPGSDEMIETDDYTITLVFNSTLPARASGPSSMLRFPFDWPQSLVDRSTGACSGTVRMTLVYLSPLNPRYGTEVVRVNLDASLRQRVAGATTKKGRPKYESRVDQCFLPKTSGRPAFERELIHQGLKWWPAKRYDKKLPSEGIGSSSEWVLEVESVVRAEAVFPPAGVPFTVLMTIEDPEGLRPIFQELRRSLQASRAQFQDIQVTAARVRSRI